MWKISDGDHSEEAVAVPRIQRQLDRDRVEPQYYS
jgi:hypothetical protein